MAGLAITRSESPDWDDFESVPIDDPELDALRIEAAAAGPPSTDFDKLRALLARAEELARR